MRNVQNQWATSCGRETLPTAIGRFCALFFHSPNLRRGRRASHRLDPPRLCTVTAPSRLSIQTNDSSLNWFTWLSIKSVYQPKVTATCNNYIVHHNHIHYPLYRDWFFFYLFFVLFRSWLGRIFRFVLHHFVSSITFAGTRFVFLIFLSAVVPDTCRVRIEQ